MEKDLLPEVNRVMNKNTWIFIQASVRSRCRVNIVQDFIKEKLGKRFIKHTEWSKNSRSKKLKTKIKNVWPEVALDLTEICKAMKHFITWLNTVE